jgi:acetolactate synthase-1/2/3 large subunit
MVDSNFGDEFVFQDAPSLATDLPLEYRDAVRQTAAIDNSLGALKVMAMKDFATALVEAFADRGIKDAFVVTGGAINPVTSALAKSRSIKSHYLLTEQSAAIAAEAYGYFDGRPALLVVTSGPGMTNALTGVAAAYTNSSPMVIISGQARTQDVLESRANQARQVGNQHLRTHEIVSSITKVVAEPLEPENVDELADYLLRVATTNRKGPVWLSLPQDLQRQIPEKRAEQLNLAMEEDIPSLGLGDLDLITKALASHSRPAMLLGAGSRPGIEGLLSMAECFATPVMTTWPGMDLVSEDFPLYAGRPGSIPSSWLPNLILEHCDLLLIVGARMDLAQVGYNPGKFAIQARIMQVEIDPSEKFRLEEHPNRHLFLANSEGFNLFLDQKQHSISRPDWLSAIKKWKSLPRAGEIHQVLEDGLSTYFVADRLSEKLAGRNLVTGSSGTCIEMILQSWKITNNQRLINSCGLGSMGFGIAAALGVSIKSKGFPLACLESDGSMMMNIQDLISLSKIEANIPIFIFDSRGYKSISLSQKRSGSEPHGADSETGLASLEIGSGDKLLGLDVRAVNKQEEVDEAIDWALEGLVSRIVFFRVSKSEEALPRLVSKFNPETGRMETPKMSQLYPGLEGLAQEDRSR